MSDAEFAPGQSATPGRDHPVAVVVTGRACAFFGCSLREMLHPTRGPTWICRARQTAMYLLVVEFGWTEAVAGSVFGRDPTTAWRALRTMEDLRDDAAWDVAIDLLAADVRRQAGRCA